MKRFIPIASTLLLVTVAALGLMAWRAPVVSAQGQSTANMLVVTAVLRKCFVTTSELNFGTYDPVQTHATAPLDNQVTMTVACTKGAAVTIGIDDGANAAGQVRRMAGGAASYLNYDLFQDAERLQRWGDGPGEIVDAGVAPSRDPRTFTVYGRVPGGQDVAEGAFQDAVVVTVDF